MKKLLYILPLFLFAFTSCEQDANVDVPEVEPQLVVSCFITPQDTILRAKVSMTRPVFSTVHQNGPITDATVTLYGNSSSVVLVYNVMNDAYEALTRTFPIYAGNEYHITVSVPSGLSADAYTTVPSAPPLNFSSTLEDTTLNNDPWMTNGRARLRCEFDDPAGQTDLYRMVSYAVTYQPWTNDTTTYRAAYELFSDQNADGQRIARSFVWDYYNHSGSDSTFAFDIYLLHCNYDYYSFHRSLDNYSGDNPFAEPTLIYSNVHNGRGIFAAANGVYVRHRL